MEAKPKKICFIGAPSTGKTTLAKQITEELTQRAYSVELVGEFARDYLVEHGPVKNPTEQLVVAKGQKEKEGMAHSRNPDFIVCDAASFLSQVYFNYLKDRIFDKDKIEELKTVEREIWQEVGDHVSTYDFVFFLPPEIPVQEDGVRLYTNDVGEISARIKDFLNLHRIKHHELKGTIEERAANVFKIIRK